MNILELYNIMCVSDSLLKLSLFKGGKPAFSLLKCFRESFCGVVFTLVSQLLEHKIVCYPSKLELKLTCIFFSFFF